MGCNNNCGCGGCGGCGCNRCGGCDDWWRIIILVLVWLWWTGGCATNISAFRSNGCGGCGGCDPCENPCGGCGCNG